ncbi:benzoate 4-monooxygenase cytochrome P450 [Colletotrichum paranaense]|uniref:Benzoate 4-monooxygenase cytochrome P450 n=1 Tax=Colletotrichum paranaense TaxID=1914294 RepID=A0ABQ9SSU2_9PEZI|nr:benzoate 4-monooxygenase cytochrome P450 [Colletotrichum paranaense]KAK1542061.1 benzoate 4-monooxygenase cytochrome P450 [Colletotrichum paranaense]
MSTRTALVTGSANGIGRAIALRLAQDGFQIAIDDLASQEVKLRELQYELELKGVRTAVLTADISNEDDVVNLIRNTSEMLGGIDVMVANAGVILVKPILEISASEWDKVQAINVRGVFLCYKYAAQEMIKQGRGGKLVGACSISGYRPSHFAPAYSVSKWAVRGLTQAVAMDMAQHGITVNAYCPGMVRTDMWETIDTSLTTRMGLPKGAAFENGVATRIASKKPQTPEDVAGLALYSWNFMSGRQPYRQLELHEKYGPVVRVAPNELSFSSASSWQDIYGVRKGVEPFIKSEFYDGGNFAAEALSIVSERDPKKHAEMRRYLGTAFSDRSLKSQEPMVAECVDRLIEKIGMVDVGTQGTDMVMWFNLATFDIIGSLAFGKDFGGVDSGKEHFWISIVTKSLRMGALADCFRRFPALAGIAQTVFSGLIDKLLKDSRTHQKYTMDLVQSRLASQSDREDFLTKMIEARNEAAISDAQIAAHSSDFVIAGSETTATTLSCMTYYLLKNPAILARLQDEVRSAFVSYEDITAVTATPLKYLRAVAQEAMRVYPPLPFALPRVVPNGGCTVDGHFLPGGTTVSTSTFAASMSSSNFDEPWEFRPERWLVDNPTDDLDASQPFSYGTRSCMGRSLGWMEIHTTMAKLVYRYDLELADESLDWHRDSRMHTLWEKPRLMVKLKPRVFH